MNAWLTGAQGQVGGLAEDERNSSSLLLLHLPLMKCFIFPTGKRNGPGVVVCVADGVSCLKNPRSVPSAPEGEALDHTSWFPFNLIFFDRHKPISCLLPAVGLFNMICLFFFENLIFFTDLVGFHWGNEISHSISAAESALMALICFTPSTKGMLRLHLQPRCEQRSPVLWSHLNDPDWGPKWGPRRQISPHSISQIERVVLDAWEVCPAFCVDLPNSASVTLNAL